MVELIRLNMFHVYALVHDLYIESGKCIRSIAEWFTRMILVKMYIQSVTGISHDFSHIE